MGLLSWAILGLLAGWIASLIMKTDESQGALKDILMGVVGAVVGGWVMSFFGQSGVTGVNFYSVAVAVLGAVILISVGRSLNR